MRKEIKAKMLCYLRRPCYEQNIGAVVTTVKLLAVEDGIRYWVVKARTELLDSKGKMRKEGYVPEQSLVPINDPDADVADQQQRLIHITINV